MTYKTPLILAAIPLLLISYRQVTQRKVLSQTVEIAPTIVPSPTPVPTSTPIPTVTPRPTPIPSPTPKPQPKYSPQEIYNFTESFGRQYNVDPNVIRHVALCESTFKADARNYIYAGLFQFDARTWRVYRQKMGKDADPDLRYNAREAVETAAYALLLGHGRIWPNCMP